MMRRQVTHHRRSGAARSREQLTAARPTLAIRATTRRRRRTHRAGHKSMRNGRQLPDRLVNASPERHRTSLDESRQSVITQLLPQRSICHGNISQLTSLNPQLLLCVNFAHQFYMDYQFVSYRYYSESTTLSSMRTA